MNRQQRPNEIHGTSRIRIHDGKLEEYKRLAAQCVEIVHEGHRDPGVRPIAPWRRSVVSRTVSGECRNRYRALTVPRNTPAVINRSGRRR